MRERTAALVLFLLAPFVSISAAPPYFPLRDVPRAYPSNSRNLWIAELLVFDFDRDTNPDVLVNSDTEGSILYGRGDGSLEPGVAFGRGGTWGGDTTTAVIADFDGDRLPDIISVVYTRSADFTETTSTVVLQRNLGRRAFAPRVALLEGVRSTLSVPRPVAAADFTGDGAPDVLVTFGTTAILLINDGHGAFSRRDLPQVSWDGLWKSVGDFDADGDLDFSVSYGVDFDLFLNDGSGQFTKRPRMGLNPTRPTGTAMADMNRDGVPDLLAVSPGGIAVIFGIGDGKFRVPPVVPGKARLPVIGAADFDGDGIDELLLEHGHTGWMNDDGTYTFVPLPFFPKFPTLFASAGSFPGIVLALDTTIHVLSAKGRGEWIDDAFDAGGNVTGVGMWREGNAVRIAAVIESGSGKTLRVFTAYGAQLYSVPLVRASAYPDQMYDLEARDADRDGVTDLIVSALSSKHWWFHGYTLSPDGYVSLLRGRLNGTFEPQKLIVVDRTITSVLAGDVDDSGTVDIVITPNDFISAPGSVLDGDGHGNFLERPGESLFPANIADLDLDGRLDRQEWLTITFGVRDGGGRTVNYSRRLPSTLARRRKNAPPSLVGDVDSSGDIVVIDLGPAPPRGRAARH